MADIAELGLRITFSDVLEADAALQRLESTAQGLERVVARSTSTHQRSATTFSNVSRSTISLQSSLRPTTQSLSLFQAASTNLNSRLMQTSVSMGGAAAGARVLSEELLDTNQASNSTSSGLRETAAAAETTSNSTKRATASFSRFTQSNIELQSTLRPTAGSLSLFRTEASALNTRLVQTTTQTNNAGGAASRIAGSFRPAKNAAQQLGFQLQDVAVQAQAGTNAFVILGQQGSQLAGVFGAGGALLGAAIAIGSAIGGVLFAALNSAGNESEELDDILGRLSETIDITDEGTNILTESFLRLAEASQSAARVQLQTALVDAEAAFVRAGNNIVGSVSGTIDGLTSTRDAFRDYELALQDSIGITEIFNERRNQPRFIDITEQIREFRDDLNITSQESQRLFEALFFAISEGSSATEDDTGRLIEVVSGLANQYGTANPELLSFSQSLIENARAMDDASGRADFARQALSNLSGALTENTEEARRNQTQLERLIERYQEQANSIGETTRETILRTAATLNANSQQVEAINLSFNAIEANDRETESKKRAIEAERERNRERERSAQIVARTTQSLLQSFATEEEAFNAAYVGRLATIRAVTEEGSVLQEELLARLSQTIDPEFGQTFADQIEIMRFSAATFNEEFAQSLAQTLGPDGTLLTGLSEAAAQSIVFGENFKDAAEGVGRAILSEIVSSLIQIGVTTLLNQNRAEAGIIGTALIGNAALTANTAASAVAASATAAFWAPAAALVSLASFGANAAPAAAGITAVSGLTAGIASGLGTGIGSGAAAAGPIGSSGGINSIPMFANGGVFNGGQVIDRPTAFPIGVMGEAGPEAILPLSRDSSGRLGVETSGESSSTVVMIDLRTDDFTRPIANKMITAIDSALRDSGSKTRLLARR